MGRRPSDEEIGFGNDSFLDVVTNIVGILIILIVVAGVKASRAPVDQAMLERYNPDLFAEAEVEEPAVRVEEVPIARTEPRPPQPIVIEPSRELLDFARQLEAELSELDSGRREARENLVRTSEQERELEQRRLKALAILQAERRQLEEAREKFGEVQGTLDETRNMLADLNQSLKEAANEKPAVKQIRHQLNPVSMMIDGKEIHFRLAKNRVAFVPIEELMEKVRPQIEQKKRQLLKSHSVRGEAGPVDGFVLRYIAESQNTSVVDDLRHGTSGMVKIGLAEWQILPEPDLESEDAAQALRAGSRFLQKVKATDQEVTLTMWVYPDSFELYRKLTEYAHEQGFTVAARPLPFGIPIAGSPSGSRSAGQ